MIDLKFFYFGKVNKNPRYDINLINFNSDLTTISNSAFLKYRLSSHLKRFVKNGGLRKNAHRSLKKFPNHLSRRIF